MLTCSPVCVQAFLESGPGWSQPLRHTKLSETFRVLQANFAAAMNSWGLRFPSALWGRLAL